MVVPHLAGLEYLLIQCYGCAVIPFDRTAGPMGMPRITILPAYLIYFQNKQLKWICGPQDLSSQSSPDVHSVFHIRGSKWSDMNKKMAPDIEYLKIFTSFDFVKASNSDIISSFCLCSPPSSSSSSSSSYVLFVCHPVVLMLFVFVVCYQLFNGYVDCVCLICYL